MHAGPGQALQRQLAVAVRLLQAGRLAEARAAYQKVLATDPRSVLAMHHLAIVEHQLGFSDAALERLQQCLSLKPGYAAAHSDIGVILMQLGRDQDAIAALQQAIRLNPRLAAAHCNLGDLMQRRGDAQAAESAYSKALALQPNFAAAHAGRADCLMALARLAEARQACETAIRLAPKLAPAYGVMGAILHKEHKHLEAIAAYHHALQLDPTAAVVHTRLGNVLRDAGQLEDSVAAHEAALRADYACAPAWCNLALTFQALGRIEEARDAFLRAVEIKPDFSDALVSLGMLLHRMGAFDEAITTLRRAVEVATDAAYASVHLGGVLKDQGRLAEAADHYRARFEACAGRLSPQEQYDYCNVRRHICDWEGLEEAERAAIDAVKASSTPMPPFAALAMDCGPDDHLALARLWARSFRPAQAPLRRAARLTSDKRKIRLGYLSADFFQHATASLIAEVIECHDRERFELFAYCYSSDDGSTMRRRLMNAFDHFQIIERLSNGAAAELIAGDGIDILIDLKGYTRHARSAIPALRPAPIQVNYLGYPSTMGASFIDYIIADNVIAPLKHQRWFDEAIVQLTGCYQPNDRMRQIAGPERTRADWGLPDEGFVFVSFNNAYKITAPIFGMWMRLLYQVKGSVLWLLDANPVAKDNLRREAAQRGIDPARLVFAPKIPSAEHLGRYALGDLFLDNSPVNAHTTASEALWSGLPVVTLLGEVFVGRVAASLLHACGAPDLIAESSADYESIALRLATNPAELQAIRKRLIAARDKAPLFDTPRYTRDLEAAFLHMFRRHEAGQTPAPFAVEDLAAPGAGW